MKLFKLTPVASQIKVNHKTCTIHIVSGVKTISFFTDRGNLIAVVAEPSSGMQIKHQTTAALIVAEFESNNSGLVTLYAGNGAIVERTNVSASIVSSSESPVYTKPANTSATALHTTPANTSATALHTTPANTSATALHTTPANTSATALHTTPANTAASPLNTRAIIANDFTQPIPFFEADGISSRMVTLTTATYESSPLRSDGTGMNADLLIAYLDVTYIKRIFSFQILGHDPFNSVYYGFNAARSMVFIKMQGSGNDLLLWDFAQDSNSIATYNNAIKLRLEVSTADQARWASLGHLGAGWKIQMNALVSLRLNN